MEAELARWAGALFNTVIWSAISVVIAVIVFELLELKYHLMREILHENSTAAAILGGSFVLGVFYTVAQIVIH